MDSEIAVEITTSAPGGDLCRVVTDYGIDAVLAQAAQVRALGSVAAAHPRAELIADQRQRAHASPADGDEVKLATLHLSPQRSHDLGGDTLGGVGASERVRRARHRREAGTT